MNIKSFSKEIYLFYTVLVLNMLPVLCYTFFPTMDGAAHLYNSNLINELLFQPQSIVADYFVLNTVPVPNWLGHFVLSFFNLFLPAPIAEKVLLICYMSLLPLSFRYFTKQYNSTMLSYLIFPFCYTYLFYLGFYNLSISFILLFTTLAFWKKNEQILNYKYVFVLFLLISTTYFAHIMIYAILIFTLFLMASQSFLAQLMSNEIDKKMIRDTINKYVIMLVVSLPSLCLLLFFMQQTTFFSSIEKLSTSELLTWLIDSRPLIALSYGKEAQLTRIFSVLLLVLLGAVIYSNVKENKDNFWKKIIHKLLLPQNIYLVVALIMLFLYFKVPNSGSAGMMSDRLCLLFFIYMVSWLALIKYSKRLTNIAIFVVLVVNFGLVFRYTVATKGLNKDAVSMANATKYIEPYSVVLPINNTKEWLEPHFSNYLGIDKPMIILENYEATVGWFPVKWNETKIPVLKFGNLGNENTSFTWKSGQLKPEKIIDYVIVWGLENKMNTTEITTLNQYYESIYMSENGAVQLYKLRK